MAAFAKVYTKNKVERNCSSQVTSTTASTSASASPSPLLVPAPAPAPALIPIPSVPSAVLPRDIKVYGNVRIDSIYIHRTASREGGMPYLFAEYK